MATNRENKKIAKVMAEALLGQQFVKVKIFDDSGNQQITALITKIDQEMRKIRFSHEHGVDWIPIDDILSVELA